MTAKPATADDLRPIVFTLYGLTFVTGLIDAVSYLGLGRVFTANMTGNVVFVGFALGGAADVSIARPSIALAAFAAGSVLGGRMVHVGERSAAAHLLRAMSMEITFITAAALATLAIESTGLNLVIVLTAAAMGLRNAVVRKLAVPDFTTTVLTMALTAVAADSRLAGGSAVRQGRRLLMIVVMGAGALIGTVVLRSVGTFAAFISAAVVVAFLACYLSMRAARTD
jgi:uncharacterized membrane protein YoaK (UPF0700 family)